MKCWLYPTFGNPLEFTGGGEKGGGKRGYEYALSRKEGSGLRCGITVLSYRHSRSYSQTPKSEVPSHSVPRRLIPGEWKGGDTE